jgi:hypothetical protein
MLKSKTPPYESFELRPLEPVEPIRAEEVLSMSDIRSRLAARERSVTERLASLRSEVTTLDDITLAGRPLLDHVRSHPIGAVLGAAAVGASVGVLAGLLSRISRAELDEREGLMQLMASSIIEEAARRAALGENPERALERVVRRRAPLIQYAPPSPEPRGTIRQSFDVAFKAALGVGAKAAMDALTQRLTGKPEVFKAAMEAGENPSAEAR